MSAFFGLPGAVEVLPRKNVKFAPFLNSAPMDFWQTLGQYVYGYLKDGKWQYIGKGNRNRAIQHIKEKDYDINDLYIIAKNLERFDFDRKKDAQSFLLESYLISSYTPSDNSVSGHYKECFKMAKFSELFNVYTSSQKDNFEALPEWYIENYEKLKGRLTVVEIKSEMTWLSFSTREQLQPNILVASDGNIKHFRFQIQAQEKDKIAYRKEQIFEFLSHYDIMDKDIEKTWNRETYGINSQLSIEDAFNIIDDFFS